MKSASMIFTRVPASGNTKLKTEDAHADRTKDWCLAKLSASMHPSKYLMQGFPSLSSL